MSEHRIKVVECASRILDCLAGAYAGASQFGPEEIGDALVGQRNNGWISATEDPFNAVLEVAREIATQEADRWDWTTKECYKYRDQIIKAHDKAWVRFGKICERAAAAKAAKEARAALVPRPRRNPAQPGRRTDKEEACTE